MINAQSTSPFNSSNSPLNTPVPPQNQVLTPPPGLDATQKPPQKKGLSKNLKIALGLLLLLVVVLGSSVSYYLNQQNQDVRQQADEVKPTSTPIVRPPDTTLPTATCLKTAYLDVESGASDTLVETKSFNSTQGILFRISVTKQDDKVIPLVITDDFRQFTNAGYEFVSAEVGDNGRFCTADANFNRDNPGFYRCSWSGAEQGQTIVLYIRLRPTVTYVIEPEKIEATNSVTVMPVELAGGERPAEDLSVPSEETGGRNAPTGTSNQCSVTVLIPGNSGDTTVIPSPTLPPLTCNSVCTPSLSNVNGDPDNCSRALGNAYRCVNTAADTSDLTKADFRCRLNENKSNTQCQDTTVASPVSSPTTETQATPAVGCNQTCTTNSDCSNPDHICSNVGEGQNVCRLSTNVNSSSCASAITQTTQQPSLPAELPQTGATDIATWAKAGLGALGLGMMLLLLL